MPRHEAAKHLDAIFLPPAAQRDIYAAFCHYRPSVIGLIDGVFQNVPSGLA